MMKKRGDKNVKVGSRVEFDVVSDKKERGDKACNVTAIGGNYVEQGRSLGIVKEWHTFSGTGIITAEDGTGDIEAFARDVWQESTKLNEGDRVEYDPLEDKYNGWHASYITLADVEVMQCKYCKKFDHKSAVCPTISKPVIDTDDFEPNINTVDTADTDSATTVE